MPERNIERQMYIYNARKNEKRTFADIGRELGITGTRVSQIYRRYDWEKNRYQADHHMKRNRRKGDGIVGTKNQTEEFCKCKNSSSTFTLLCEFGYWDACCDCGKPFEDGYHPYDEEMDIDE